MYIVVSEWEAFPGKEEEFDRIGKEVARVLRAQPGVLLLHAFNSGSKKMSVHGYQDEATYRALVHDPNSAFARSVADKGLERIARWVRSESGETIELG